MREHRVGHLDHCAVLSIHHTIFGWSACVGKFVANTMGCKIPIKRKRQELAAFVRTESFDLVTRFFLNHDMPLLKTGEGLIGGKKINPGIATVIINEQHKVPNSTERGMFLGSAKINANNGQGYGDTTGGGAGEGLPVLFATEATSA